ncbi:unnamed protein product, partial [Allacma fusca]
FNNSIFGVTKLLSICSECRRRGTWKVGIKRIFCRYYSGNPSNSTISSKMENVYTVRFDRIYRTANLQHFYLYPFTVHTRPRGINNGETSLNKLHVDKDTGGGTGQNVVETIDVMWWLVAFDETLKSRMY